MSEGKRNEKDSGSPIFLIPQNNILTLFFVKTAAQLSDGPSVKCMTVPRIGNCPRAGASTDTNFPLAVPVAKPFGNFERGSMYFMYSSLLANSGKVSGVSVAPARRSDANRRCLAAGEELAPLALDDGGDDNR